jgi:antitoxin VapB
MKTAKTTLPTTTRTFKSGNSIAVRIPHEFKLEAGRTLEIKRRGKELVLIEREQNLGFLVDLLQSMPADFFPEGRIDPPPQERDFSFMFGEKPKKQPRTTKAASKAVSRKK